MPYPIEDKLVIAVASSALFDLSECDRVFHEKGEAGYRQYQRDNQHVTLSRGVAFPFIRRFLNLNNVFPETEPVEVVLLSKNDSDTGLRVLNSIRDYGLNITRAGFLNGKPPYSYIPAFNCSLFLSANPKDVKDAIDAGHPAGTFLKTQAEDDPADKELRIAFDFDGVIADDQAERVYQRAGKLQEFHSSEIAQAAIPHEPGPLGGLFKRLSAFQKLEQERRREHPAHTRVLRIAIVTARSAPSHERVVTTLRDWGVVADETFFLGGIEKRRFLEVLKPHIYFDDQMSHLRSAAGSIPSVHIPFGITNTI